MGLAAVMLFVRDLDRMAAFYRDVLGLQPVEETRLPDSIEFRGGGVRFSLHAIPAAIAAEIGIDSPPRPREHAAAKLTFAVEDVAVTLANIEQMGLPVLHRPWGATDAADPEGNVFAVSATS